MREICILPLSSTLKFTYNKALAEDQNVMLHLTINAHYSNYNSVCKAYLILKIGVTSSLNFCTEPKRKENLEV